MWSSLHPQTLSDFFPRKQLKGFWSILIATIKCHGQGPIGRGKGLFHFTAYIPLWREVRAGTRTQELEAGTGGRNWGQAIEESCLFACLPCVAKSAFLFHLPRGDTTHSRLDPPTSIISQEFPTHLLIRQSDQDIFSMGVSCFPYHDD